MKIGKVSGNVLKRSVLRQIKTKRREVVSGAGAGADCAIFSLPAGEAAVTCMQEAVVMLQEEDGEGSDDGKFRGARYAEPYMTLAQLIQKCANNLAAGGAEPFAAMLALSLPECVEEPEIRALMIAAEQKCAELSMMLIGGQTRVTGYGRGAFAVVTGYGRMPLFKAGKDACGDGGVSLYQEESSRMSAQIAGNPMHNEENQNNHGIHQKMAPGQDIVVSKWIGLQGTAILARRNRKGLLERYPAYLIEEALGFDRYLTVIPEAAAAVKSGVCAMHDVSEGGIFGALWEMAEGAGVGLNIDMRKLPLRQETVEICEFCNANPYELLSGGCLLMAAWDGQRLVSALAEAGIPAVIVGKATAGKDRILHNGDEIRYLDRPKQDQVYCSGETEVEAENSLAAQALWEGCRSKETEQEAENSLAAQAPWEGCRSKETEQEAENSLAAQALWEECRSKETEQEAENSLTAQAPWEGCRSGETELE